MRPVLAVVLVACAALVMACSAQPAGLAGTPARPPEGKPTEAPKPAVQAPAGTAAAPTPAPAAKPGAAAKPAPTAPAAPAAQAPAQPTPATRPVEPIAVPPAQLGRMVIYTTELSILVKDLPQVVNAVGDIVAQVGGYVAGVENKEEQGRPLTTVRLKVPPERYEQAMRQLRGLAVEVTDEKAATQDVTEEFNDLQTQLAALEASHAQLLELMGRAQNVEELLKIQERLAQTKGQIDRIKGRITFLQRSSDLATITVHARAAEDVLARTYSALRGQLRKAEAQRATTLAALRRARTAEEEATLRDRLAEASLEIDRLGARLKDIEARAQGAGIALPAGEGADTAATSPIDDDLAREYVALRAQLRAAQAEQDRLTRELSRQRADDPDLRARLSTAIVEVSRLTARIKVVQERAAQTGLTLPTLTAEQEAVLAGTDADDPARTDPWRAAATAWDASLRMLATVATALVSVVVFLWWALPLAAAGVWAWRRRLGARRSASPGTP